MYNEDNQELQDRQEEVTKGRERGQGVNRTGDE